MRLLSLKELRINNNVFEYNSGDEIKFCLLKIHVQT